eukprot:TRINITY_DN1949_c0_g1_i10.p1 TRINITY_DN1949_c0_g1~~TRINITY_DN1949_c0_g1_i10.p1  ORF type:complete len:143 (+),score=13.00 TRINITY_DN1949_c0_g1_i10:84-512(+)
MCIRDRIYVMDIYVATTVKKKKKSKDEVKRISTKQTNTQLNKQSMESEEGNQKKFKKAQDKKYSLQVWTPQTNISQMLKLNNDVKETRREIGNYWNNAPSQSLHKELVVMAVKGAVPETGKQSAQNNKTYSFFLLSFFMACN